MQGPTISIIVPIYGVEKYIRQCADTVLGQTYPNIQFIFVNDGTKDNSMQVLDELIREVLGEKLLTPAEMMGDYPSLRAMREADGWLPLSDCAGRVVVLLHDTTVTKDYISQDETIKSQAMFPMLRYKDRDKDYASFLIVNKPKDIDKYSQELIFEKKLVIRTRVDSYGSYNEEDRILTLESGAQILSTDYPPKADMTEVEYVVGFDKGTARDIK